MNETHYARDIRGVLNGAEADSLGLARFVIAMREKLAAKRTEGRSGWNVPYECTVEDLQRWLQEHACKGDPVDVGNYAMMVWNRQRPNGIVGLGDIGPWPFPAGQSVAFDLVAHLDRQKAFSERTFGPGARTQGVIDHIRKELLEVEESPHDVTEWVDVVLLALDGAWRAGWTPAQIAQAIADKQARNEARTWPDWRTQPADKAIEHARPSVIVHGPHGCGKTNRAAKMLEHFRLKHLIDGWEPGDPAPTTDTLILTCHDVFLSAQHSHRIVSFADAMMEMKWDPEVTA